MNSDELQRLIALREVVNQAISAQRRVDRCHQAYMDYTNTHGFSRAKTTSYNARAAGNAESKMSAMKELKKAVQEVFHDTL